VTGDNEHIDQLIRQKFEDFEPLPPESAWVNIKKQVQSGNSSGSGTAIFTILTIIGLIVTVISILLNVNDIQTINAANADQLNDNHELILPSPQDEHQTSRFNDAQDPGVNHRTENVLDSRKQEPDKKIIVRKNKKATNRKINHLHDLERFINENETYKSPNSVGIN